MANFKETQVAGMEIGQPITFTVDALAHARLSGRIEAFSPAAGSEFSVIKGDNATGNFTKVTQRIPVRIAIDPDQALGARLEPGMSVVVSVDTRRNCQGPGCAAAAGAYARAREQGDDALLPNGEEHFPHRRSP